MSDAPLPDDVSRWPEDPYELLGVPRDVTPRDLRRAYTRLIRAYKPEQFPEQFRRIRAAYEAALRLAEFFAAGAVPVEEAAAAPEPIGPPRPADAADDPDALWERAVAGDEAGAYAALADLHRRRPGRADVPLRLYWLLALNPDLDPGRAPASWLVAALAESGLGGPAAELYRRELDERPAEALDAGARLLETAAAPEWLAALTAWRAGAAVRLKRWDVLRADLDAARQRVRPFDEPSWLQLNLAVLDGLAWEVGDPAAVALGDDCRREIAGLAHLAVHHAAAFDRLDFLTAVAKDWRAVRSAGDVPADLVALLPRAWARPFAEVRPLLVRVLEQVAAAPRNWLRHLDALEYRGPAALAYFGGLLGQYQDRLPEPPPVPHTPEALAALANAFFDAAGWQSYMALRSRVLELCLREAVGPELVAMVVPGRLVGGAAGAERVVLAEALAKDWPLRYVCWACRLFWA